MKMTVALFALVVSTGCRLNPESATPSPSPVEEEGACGERSVPVDDWAAIVAGYQGKVRSVPRSAPEACTAAHRIVTMCPSYDRAMVRIREEVCASAVREELATIEASMSSLSMNLPSLKELGEPQQELWENRGERSLALSVARLEVLRPVAAEAKALLARVSLLQKEAAELDDARADAGAFPDGCSGFQALEKRVTEMETRCKNESVQQRICPLLVAIFSGELERRRQSSIGEPTRKIRKVLGENPNLEDAQDLTPFSSEVALVRELLDGLKCYQPPRLTEWEPEVQKWAAEREAAVEAERKCRRTPSCLAARAAAKARAAAAAAAASGTSGGGTVGGCTCRDGVPGCSTRGCCSGHGGIMR